MNTPTFNRIALGIAVPALAAGAWSTAGLVTIDKLPLPSSPEPAVPIKGSLPAPPPENKISGEWGSSGDKVTSAETIWGDEWKTLWQNIENLSKNIPLDQRLTAEDCIKFIVDNSSQDIVKELKTRLNIDETSNSGLGVLDELSNQIITLLGERSGSLVEICSGYSEQLNSFGDTCAKQINSIKGAIAKSEAEQQKTTASQEKPKSKPAPPNSSSPRPTRGADKLPH